MWSFICVKTVFTFTEITSTVTQTTKQLNSLISELKETAIAFHDGREPTSGSSHDTHGNFTKSTVRFNCDQLFDVDVFPDTIEINKDCAYVSDANVLRGVLILLENAGATYWRGVTWTFCFTRSPYVNNARSNCANNLCTIFVL